MSTISAIFGFLLSMGMLAIILLALTVIIVFLIQQLVKAFDEAGE
jgi:uncharacterized membrane protein